MYHSVIKSLSHPGKVLASLGYGAAIVTGSLLVPTAIPSEPMAPTQPVVIADSPTATEDTVEAMFSTPPMIVADATEDNLNVTSEQQTQPETSPFTETIVGNTIVEDGVSYPLREYTITAIPNDPDSGQWWETAINAPTAWDISTGDSSVTIAVIDTGFALDHEEFTGRWHENTGEQGATASENPSQLNCSDQSLALNYSCNLIDDNFDGIVDNESGTAFSESDSRLNCTDQGIALDKSCNLVDDDSNGFIDDVTGFDFYNFDGSVQAGETNPNGTGTRHGTYVASAAAANTNNGVGIAGVSWNATILPIQALDDDGNGNSLTVARSVSYAVSQGADIISMSLGGAFPDPYLRFVVQNAIDQGIVVVAASGNDGCNCVSYPANYPEVIAVGALDYSLDRASFTSYGANLDISAPGVGLRVASWTSSNGTNAYASGINGTSLATPLVSGALANLKSQQPDASVLQLTAALIESSDRSHLSASQLRTDDIGFGKLDVLSSNQRLVTPFVPEVAYSFGGLFVDDMDDENNVYQCDSTLGFSGIYKLTSGSTTRLANSLVTVSNYEDVGYASSLLFYGCVLQPHDTPAQLRVISTANELLGITIK